MKWSKTLSWAIALQLLLAGSATAAPAEKPVLVTVNGHVSQLKHPSVLVNGRTYMSAEDLADLLHGTVKQSGEVFTLTVKQQQVSFKLTKPEIMLGKEWKTTDQRALLRGQKVYLPMRLIVELSGLQVKWDPIHRVVTIVAPEGIDSSVILLTKEDLTKEEQAFVEKVRKTRGVHQKGNLYAIARGESPNPGYGLRVVGSETQWEQVRVFVKLTKPEPGLMYPQVIAYPYVLARVTLPNYTTVAFLDADTKKPLFEK